MGSVRDYTGLVVASADSQGIQRSLWAGLLQAENGAANPYAVSAAGALGLAQVMPFHFRPGEDPFDPRTNLMRGAEVLRRGYDACRDWDVALAAYYGAVDNCRITSASDVSGVTGWGYVELVRRYQQGYRDLDGAIGPPGLPLPELQGLPYLGILVAATGILLVAWVLD